jgi:hypothetical protein
MSINTVTAVPTWYDITSNIKEDTTPQNFELSCLKLSENQKTNTDLYFPALEKAVSVGNAILIQHIAENYDKQYLIAEKTGDSLILPYTAIQFNQYESLKTLIDLGANLQFHVQDEDQTLISPLDYAIRQIFPVDELYECSTYHELQTLAKISDTRIIKLISFINPEHRLLDPMQQTCLNVVVDQLAHQISAGTSSITLKEKELTEFCAEKLIPQLEPIIFDYSLDENEEFAAHALHQFLAQQALEMVQTKNDEISATLEQLPEHAQTHILEYSIEENEEYA